MATNLKTSITSRNAELNALAALANSGILRVYDGTQPATPETAVSSQVKLAELTMNATAFASASAGVLTANAITSATCLASSTAAWYRLLKSDGTTVLWDGSVGTASADLIFTSVAFASGTTISVSSLTYTLPQ